MFLKIFSPIGSDRLLEVSFYAEKTALHGFILDTEAPFGDFGGPIFMKGGQDIRNWRGKWTLFGIKLRIFISCFTCWFNVSLNFFQFVVKQLQTVLWPLNFNQSLLVVLEIFPLLNRSCPPIRRLLKSQDIINRTHITLKVFCNALWVDFIFHSHFQLFSNWGHVLW